jgi:UDP-glucose 4-epimerase
MRIFISGGAGYVGSHCAALLRQGGHELLIYDNLSMGHLDAIEKSELVLGDLDDRVQLNLAMNWFKPDAVMHFAASTAVGESVQKPLEYYRNNVANTINLLDAMKECSVKKMVFSSSCAVYGIPPQTPMTEDMPKNPLSPYGRTKLMMEEILSDCNRAWGLGYAALRYFNASGASLDGSLGEDHHPETHLIPIVLQVAMGTRAHVEVFGNDYETQDGTCIRDYIHVEDLAEAHQQAFLTLKPELEIRCNLGTGMGHSVMEVIKTAESVTGKSIKVKMGPRRPGDPAKLYADPSYAKQILNWQTKINDLETIIQTAWDWHSQNPKGFMK